MTSEIMLGESGLGTNLNEPDICDTEIFSASSSNPTKVISVTQKPRYVIMSLTSLVISSSGTFRNLLITCADKDSNASKSVAITAGGTIVSYDDTDMKSPSDWNCGLISVTDSAVTIKGQLGYEGYVVTMIYY